MKKIIQVIVIANLALAADCVSQEIYGFVKSSYDSLLSDASVFAANIGEDITDKKGRYSIDLSNCSYCKPGTTVTLNVNSSFGYTQKEYTIPSSSSVKPFDIVVPRNSKLILTGKVKDKSTGKFIQGIKVTPIITGYEIDIPSTVTDDRGIFQFIINKSGIGSNQAIELTFIDVDNSKYRDEEKVVFTNQIKPITIELEECTDCGSRTNLHVNDFIKSKIWVEAGDIVIIRAGGVMKVGNFVGSSGPEGLPNNRGVLGMSLSGYNYFKNWNHAVLVYRIGENSPWTYYRDNKENRLLVQHSGYIEFGVNDNNLSDNSGAYSVEVIVKK